MTAKQKAQTDKCKQDASMCDELNCIIGEGDYWHELATVGDVVCEAEYILSTYFEGGHTNNEMLTAMDDPPPRNSKIYSRYVEEAKEATKTARREINQIKRFLKKYKSKA